MSEAHKVIDKKLLDVLACPICKVKVELVEDNVLQCSKCGKKYDVKNGVPQMLVKEEEIK